MEISRIEHPTNQTYPQVARCQCNLETACEIKSRIRQGWTYAGRHQPWRCSRDSFYEIDGVKLCAQHAGRLALSYLIMESQREFK